MTSAQAKQLLHKVAMLEAKANILKEEIMDIKTMLLAVMGPAEGKNLPDPKKLREKANSEAISDALSKKSAVSTKK